MVAGAGAACAGASVVVAGLAGGAAGVVPVCAREAVAAATVCFIRLAKSSFHEPSSMDIGASIGRPSDVIFRVALLPSIVPLRTLMASLR